MAVKENLSFKEKLNRVFYFFPLQLLIYQLKRNQFLLLLWFFLYLLTNNNFGSTYGIPSLFYFPEYLGKVGFWSHFILGFSLGGFVMAFHIASYIANGFKFPFIATLTKPFYKYAVNNSFIPTIFIALYSTKMFKFQVQRELLNPYETYFNIFAFLLGITAFISLTITYFVSTNKSLETEKTKPKNFNSETNEPVKNLLHKPTDWTAFFQNTTTWDIKTYLSGFFKIKLARPAYHYDKFVLSKIIKQNHINAAIFEIGLIATVVAFGLFGNHSFFFIPAGAGIFLMFTIILMLYSAARSWLGNWAPVALLSVLFLVNFLSEKKIFNYTNQAYGLNYQTLRPTYSNLSIARFNSNKTMFDSSYTNQQNILHAWLKKAQQLQQKQKPKLVLVSCSGGGLRSATWTYTVLHHLDSLTNGNFFNQIHIISGTSGGSIGAALYREINLNAYQISYEKAFNMLSKDILNPLVYTFAVNDMFFRRNNIKISNNIYTKDRGYIFENQLNNNTNNLLNKKLIKYRKPEAEGKIPQLIFSPTIANDGRRLLIGANNLYCLTQNQLNKNINPVSESIFFNAYFKNQFADSLEFSSALRMNSTFPYITPNVTLPSNPEIEVMDAGVRDNFGVANLYQFVNLFSDWIQEHTSGVVIIQIRDKNKTININQNPSLSLFEALFNPLGGFTRNWIKIQMYNQDAMLQYLAKQKKLNIWQFDLALNHDEKSEIPISWHLTQIEQLYIKNGVKNKQFKDQVKNVFTVINN